MSPRSIQTSILKKKFALSFYANLHPGNYQADCNFKKNEKSGHPSPAYVLGSMAPLLTHYTTIASDLPFPSTSTISGWFPEGESPRIQVMEVFVLDVMTHSTFPTFTTFPNSSPNLLPKHD